MKVKKKIIDDLIRWINHLDFKVVNIIEDYNDSFHAEWDVIFKHDSKLYKTTILKDRDDTCFYWSSVEAIFDEDEDGLVKCYEVVEKVHEQVLRTISYERVE